MTCRHLPDDSSCSSHPMYVSPYRVEEPKTPDATKYEIEQVERVGAHLVMKVLYPNCASCAYEGRKTMVFLDVTEVRVLKWRKIDPHFRDPKLKGLPTDAPSPAARFPASAEGWADALEYARGKSRPVTR